MFGAVEVRWVGRPERGHPHQPAVVGEGPSVVTAPQVRSVAQARTAQAGAPVGARIVQRAHFTVLPAYDDDLVPAERAQDVIAWFAHLFGESEKLPGRIENAIVLDIENVTVDKCTTVDRAHETMDSERHRSLLRGVNSATGKHDRANRTVHSRGHRNLDFAEPEAPRGNGVLAGPARRPRQRVTAGRGHRVPPDHALSLVGGPALVIRRASDAHRFSWAGGNATPR